MPLFDLRQYGITVSDTRRNLSPARLYAEAIREDPECVIADSGAPRLEFLRIAESPAAGAA